ncbi:MAG TPA: acyl-CoA dehydrogenase family protein [Actinomycetota bacterium]|nr:acyl-CoA dehydrogenase family protein [Actinomycetota bacterium]
MDFSLSAEQQMLREEARSWLAAKLPAERVVEIADSGSGWDPDLWPQMAELGWVGLSAPSEAGGAGMTFLEEAVLFEEFGRALYPGPFFATVGLCLPALSAVPDLCERVAAGEITFSFAWAEPSGPLTLYEAESYGTKAANGDGAWRLSGEKVLVPDAAAVSHFVVAAGTAEGPALFAAEAHGERSSTMDSTRPLGTVRFDETPATMIAGAEAFEGLLERIRLRAHAALALEGVGVAEAALTMAVDHSKTRSQFGRPIGAYQAVSHQVADTYMDVELARSLAYWAAWCVAEADPQAPAAVAAAKSFAGEAAVRACERSIQVHGGMGFTWEHMLHRYYKRAQWIDSFDGYGPAHRAEIAGRLVD